MPARWYRQATEEEVRALIGQEMLREAQDVCAWNGLGSTYLVAYEGAVFDELARCWEVTAETEVPQYRDGECEVRRIWDDAVAEALGWEKERLAELRHLLHQKPHVRGLGYNQFG